MANSIQPAGAKSLTLEEAQTWVQKVPALLREQAQHIPTTSEQVDQRANGLGTPYRVTGLGIGAVLAAATFTKLVPSYWKLATGIAAVGSGALGLYVGGKMDDVVKAMKYGIPEIKKAILKYADTIETNEQLKNQLAVYLTTNITPQEMASREMGDLVAGKSVAFGQFANYLDINSLAKETAHIWRCAENPNPGDCAIAR